MEKIIKKAKEVREAISRSLEEGSFNDFGIECVFYINGGFNKIKFFNSVTDIEPYGDKYLIEITYIGDRVLTFFGEQSRNDFVLNSEALKSIAELCEVVNEYLKESEK